MGRKWGKRRDKKPRDPSEPRQHKHYDDVVMSNELFENYYRSQSILDESELIQLFECFRVPLPTTFRFTGSRKSAVDQRNNMIKTYLPILKSTEIDGAPAPVPTPIPW